MLAVSAGSLPLTGYVVTLAGTVTPAGPVVLAGTVAPAGSVASSGLPLLAGLTGELRAVGAFRAFGAFRTFRAFRAFRGVLLRRLTRRILGMPVSWVVRPARVDRPTARPSPAVPFACSLVASLRGTLGVIVRLVAGGPVVGAWPAPIGGLAVSSVADPTASRRGGPQRATGLVLVGLRPLWSGVPLLGLGPLTRRWPW
jgi:hypothetical protein